MLRFHLEEEQVRLLVDSQPVAEVTMTTMTLAKTIRMLHWSLIADAGVSALPTGRGGETIAQNEDFDVAENHTQMVQTVKKTSKMSTIRVTTEQQAAAAVAIGDDEDGITIRL